MKPRPAVAEWLSSWLAEQEFRGSIPGLVTWISEIGYLLLPICNMAEIPLKRRKSSIQPINQPKETSGKTMCPGGVSVSYRNVEAPVRDAHDSTNVYMYIRCWPTLYREFHTDSYTSLGYNDSRISPTTNIAIGIGNLVDIKTGKINH